MAVRFRFRLRTLIVLVLIVGGMMGWIAYKFRQARRQHDAAVAVVSRYGTVDYGRHFRLDAWTGRLQMSPPPNHVWLRKWLGDDMFDTVTVVSFFRQKGVTDADMALLDAFPDLEDFHVSIAPVSDLAHLAGLKKLRGLTLIGVPIADSDLRSIARLPVLTDVSLGGTRIGDAGVAMLGTMPQLRTLDLEWTRVTDAGVAHLAGLKRLEWLQLTCTEITDAGLDHLRGLKSLKFLWIGATRVSPEGKASIEAALPGCRVVWWERQGDLSQAGGRPEIPEPQPTGRAANP